MKQVDRGRRFYRWTRRRGRNIQIIVFGTVLLIGCLGIAVIIGLVNTITGDDSNDEVVANSPTATPTPTEIELTATPDPTASQVPPTATTELTPTPTNQPSEPSPTEPAAITATEQPSEATAVSNQPPPITDAGRAYVQQARDFLAELDTKVANADREKVDVTDWGAWSHDWNTRRQTAYEECGAQGNLEVGVLACLPLADLFNVWAAEDNLLLDQDSELMDVDTARKSLEEDFGLIEQQ